MFLQLYSRFCLRISLLESNYYPERKNLLNSSFSALFNLKMGKCSELHSHKCHLSHCLSIIHISNIQNNSCEMNIKPFPLNSAGNCMFKVNNRNTRTRYEICSNLTIKTPERCQWRRSGVFTVKFEHISYLLLVFLLLTLSR